MVPEDWQRRKKSGDLGGGELGGQKWRRRNDRECSNDHNHKKQEQQKTMKINKRINQLIQKKYYHLQFILKENKGTNCDVVC